MSTRWPVLSGLAAGAPSTTRAAPGGKTFTESGMS